MTVIVYTASGTYQWSGGSSVADAFDTARRYGSLQCKSTRAGEGAALVPTAAIHAIVAVLPQPSKVTSIQQKLPGGAAA